MKLRDGREFGEAVPGHPFHNPKQLEHRFFLHIIHQKLKKELTKTRFNIIYEIIMEKLIEVKLVGLIMDPISKTPVIILKPTAENKIIPIWIGEFEANAITMELENIKPPRPMTHDLIKDILTQLDCVVEKVVINNVIENTYYAVLYIDRHGDIKNIDCRPSDAVSIALKYQASIYITEYVYSTSVLSDFFADFVHNEERFEKWFNSLSSEDFGNIEQ